ncbi:MAG: methylated-DNA--[protein]-cysteine S-methyltransferase [Alphaproteobacteria bacterium]|nr:methylated-DNA--[protein]-cysteine S-methyltransferase [Alphaproteobacteria bacterium]
MALCHTVVSTPLGAVIIAADDHTLAGVWFVGQTHAPDIRDWRHDDQHPLLQRAATQVVDYLLGKNPRFNLPLSTAIGTPFQRRVWQRVSRIRRGQVLSYADIATDLGQPKASRAVGAAVGRNPWLMVVPCHRVVGRDGSLTGYAAGLDRKQTLLRMEGALH